MIEVDDDGTVLVAGNDKDSAAEAMKQVEACTATVQIGKIYDGIVSSIKDFGAFVEILPGRDGLCHISELSSGYISIPQMVKAGIWLNLIGSVAIIVIVINACRLWAAWFCVSSVNQSPAKP